MEETSKIFIEAFKQIPQYLSTFGALISSPVKFIGKQIDDESTESLSRAVMFASVSAFIAIIAGYLGLLPNVNFYKLLLTVGLQDVFEIILTFVVFSIGFKVISCPISSHKIVNTVLYLFSVTQFIGALTILALEGSPEKANTVWFFYMVAVLCWLVVPIRALALSANLNYRQGIGLAIILVPATLAVRGMGSVIFAGLGIQ